jgi:hypothetical protein
VFCSVEGEILDDSGPMMALAEYQPENREVFLNCPFPALNFVVEVIVPMLPALFGSFEVFSIRFEEENLGNLRPFTVKLASK